MDRTPTGRRAGEGDAASRRIPDVVAPPPGHPRFPLLDSLRGIAALAIVMFHAAAATSAGRLDSGPVRPLLDHLDVGVPIFFVLSGFLLYRPFVAARAGGPAAASARTFIWRRALRILPAYWLALTVLAIYPGLHNVFSSQWWVYYGLMQIYPVYTLAPGCSLLTCGNPTAWTLNAEVAFYFLLPLIALLSGLIVVRRGRYRASVEFAGCVLLAIAALAATSARLNVPTGLLATTFVWFALGMALSVVSVANHRSAAWLRVEEAIAKHPLVPWIAAAAIYVALAELILPLGNAHFAYGTASVIEQNAAFGIISVLLVAPAVFGGSAGGRPRRVLAHPALAWLGLISYGIYLWHLPILLKLHDLGARDWIPGSGAVSLFVVTLVITIACAGASYYLLERPILKLKYRRARSRRGATTPASARAD